MTETRVFRGLKAALKRALKRTWNRALKRVLNGSFLGRGVGVIHCTVLQSVGAFFTDRTLLWLCFSFERCWLLMTSILFSPCLLLLRLLSRSLCLSNWHPSYFVLFVNKHFEGSCQLLSKQYHVMSFPCVGEVSEIWNKSYKLEKKSSFLSWDLFNPNWPGTFSACLAEKLHYCNTQRSRPRSCGSARPPLAPGREVADLHGLRLRPPNQQCGSHRGCGGCRGSGGSPAVGWSH